MSEAVHSPIRNFYSDKTVLLTGVTGTVGKIVLERLLRYCDSVGTVYVLIRPGRAGDAEARLKELLKSDAYKTAFSLNKIDSALLAKKVVAVSGDLEKSDLGLTQETRERLLAQTEIVIHCGANVKFNLPVDEAIRINCGGSRSMVALFSGSKRLVSYVHVSTVFLKGDQLLDEKVEELSLEFLRNFDGSTASKTELPKGIGNTYILSKLVSEHEVYKTRYHLPLVVARLPIVDACHREPILGYAETRHTTSGYMLAIGSGLQPYGYGKLECRTQLVPAESCANFLVAVAWARGTLAADSSEAPVYNLASSKPVDVSDVTAFSNTAFLKYPVKDMLWYPRIRLVRSWVLLKVLRVLFVYLPAMAFDLLSILQDRVPVITKKQVIVDQSMDQFAYFTGRNWNIRMDNTLKLADELQGQDRTNFAMTPEVDWKDHFENHYKCLRKYCLKLEDESAKVYKAGLQGALYREIFRMTLVPAVLCALGLLFWL